MTRYTESKAMAAARAILAWLESEKAGPDYGSQTRDTHPDGERIWREWWERQLRLCDASERLAREAVEGLKCQEPDCPQFGKPVSNSCMCGWPESERNMRVREMSG